MPSPRLRCTPSVDARTLLGRSLVENSAPTSRSPENIKGPGRTRHLKWAAFRFTGTYPNRSDYSPSGVEPSCCGAPRSDWAARRFADDGATRARSRSAHRGDELWHVSLAQQPSPRLLGFQQAGATVDDDEDRTIAGHAARDEVSEERPAQSRVLRRAPADRERVLRARRVCPERDHERVLAEPNAVDHQGDEVQLAERSPRPRVNLGARSRHEPAAHRALARAARDGDVGPRLCQSDLIYAIIKWTRQLRTRIVDTWGRRTRISSSS